MLGVSLVRSVDHRKQKIQTTSMYTTIPWVSLATLRYPVAVFRTIQACICSENKLYMFILWRAEHSIMIYGISHGLYTLMSY